MVMPPPPTHEPVNEDWLVTYADAITLLMAFFVLLLSFSKVDMEIYDKVANGLAESIAREERKSDKESLKENLKETIISEGADDVVRIGTDAEGSITLELDSGAFFKKGSAELQEQALPILKQFYVELSSELFQSFNISIEGHTDDVPIKTEKFPSNWELSTSRASTVVRFFIAEGMKDTRLKAIGFGATQPKVPNKNLVGEPILENRTANRRVVIRVNRNQIYEKIKIPTFRKGLNTTN